MTYQRQFMNIVRNLILHNVIKIVLSIVSTFIVQPVVASAALQMIAVTLIQVLQQKKSVLL